MSFRDRFRDFVVDQTTDVDGAPALSRRATQACAMVADMTADHSTAGAAAIAALGAAAVAAQGALTNYIHPPGPYATFREDER